MRKRSNANNTSFFRNQNANFLVNEVVRTTITHRNFSKTSRMQVSFVYKVTLKTGNKLGAGTDSNIYLRMIGARGSTDEIMLKTSKTELERGMIDNYNIVSDDVGALRKIIIRHDNSGFAPGWYLDWVSISDGKGKKYNFNCDDWLIKDESYGNIKLLKEDNHVDKNTRANVALSDQSIDENVSSSSKVSFFNDSANKKNKDDELILSNLSDLKAVGVGGKINDKNGLVEFEHASTSTSLIPSNPSDLYDNELVDIHKNIFTRKTTVINTIPPMDEFPHLFMSSSCSVDKLISYIIPIEKNIVDFARTIVLIRIFSKALIETLNHHSILDMLVFCNGGAQLIKMCDVADVHNLYNQFKEQSEVKNDYLIPQFGLNIVDRCSELQLSSILRVGQTICLNVGETKRCVDLGGNLSKSINIAISCDTRVISEQTCELLLVNCKKYITNPELIST